MPLPPDEQKPVRSLTELNAEIRALVDGGLGSLEARQKYERLLVEWGSAVQEGVVEAA
ncbi:hypothetical protein [Streptomyces sp. HB132]|uniref:hypothetical protein n=1 Tax=Streptomyces sp. HB132 TaxID=767388 RepID=UPI0019601C08|nr:hypothetical protein [Streptomyces sp. HB132]MBM7442262.1 hypothetical protein [Streptomyces sp. HB132]